MATAGIGTALRTGDRGALSRTGQGDFEHWVNQVADLALVVTPGERQKMVEEVFEARKRATVERVNQELRRSGVVGVGTRKNLMWTLGADTAWEKELRAQAKVQVAFMEATDRKAVEAWRKQQLAKGGWPQRNRYQVNADLGRRLEQHDQARAALRAQSETKMASGAAAAHYYEASGLASPGLDKHWYFWPKFNDGHSCSVCLRLVNRNPYTLKGLVSALRNAKAMSPSAFFVHPHERHDGVFRPPKGKLRGKQAKQKAEQFAMANGAFVPATGTEVEAPPEVSRVRPGTGAGQLKAAGPAGARGHGKPPPRTRVSSSARTPARVRVVCGAVSGQVVPGPRLQKQEDLLAKMAPPTEVPVDVVIACDALRDQELGDQGERLTQALVGGERTNNTVPFALVDDEAKVAWEVKVKRAAAAHQQVRMGPDAKRRKQEWLDEHPGYAAHTACLVVDDERGVSELRTREGFGSFRVAALEHNATVDRSGKTTWHRPLAGRETAPVLPMTADYTPAGMAKWMAALSDDEEEAVDSYMTTMDGCWELRDASRGLKVSGEVERRRQALEAAIDRAPHYRKPLWRGEYVQASEFDARFTEGETMTMDSITSATPIRQLAQVFIDHFELALKGDDEFVGRRVMLHIAGSSSARAISNLEEDLPGSKLHEVLLRKGERFTVKSIKYGPAERIWMVELEEAL